MRHFVTIVATAALLLIPLNSTAQTKQYDIDLTMFNAIVVGGEFEVTVEPGDAFHAQVTIEEPYREYLVCEVHGQVLSIDIDDKNVPNDVKRLYRGKGAATPSFKAVVTTPDNLSSITLEDKSSLSSVKDFNVGYFRLKVTDNATLAALVVNASDSTTIKTARRGNASLTLITKELNMEVDGNSTLNLTQTSRTIDAKINGFSNLSMRGDAESMDFNCTGNSKVIISGTVPAANYTINGACNVNAHNVICNEAVVKMNNLCTLSEAASEKLNVEIAGGSLLIFDNNPSITVEEVKNSTIRKYSTTVKK